MSNGSKSLNIFFSTNNFIGSFNSSQETPNNNLPEYASATDLLDNNHLGNIFNSKNSRDIFGRDKFLPSSEDYFPNLDYK